MIIYKIPDSVWINTSDGVTIYFSYNELAGYMSCYAMNACGIPNSQPFGNCKSREDGRRQLEKLTQSDADRLFSEIRDWDMNKDYPLELWQEASCTEPITQ